MKLVRKTKINKPSTTFNLHIENNHNYVANNVLVSNCHGLRGNVIKEIVADYAAKIPYRFGVTGTLPKDPLEELGVIVSVGPVRYNIDAKSLIDRGVLATLQIECVQLQENLMPEYELYLSELSSIEKPVTYAKFKDQYFPEYAAEKSYLQHNDDRIRWIADRIMDERDRHGNVLCFIGSIPMSRKVASLIPGCIVINGQDVANPKKRQVHYDRFENEDGIIMIATPNVAGTGLSINRIFCLMAVDLGRSFTRVIQAIGRGLRTSEDKKNITFVDIGSDLKFGKQHLKVRTDYYDEASYPYTIKKIKYKV